MIQRNPTCGAAQQLLMVEAEVVAVGADER